MNYDISGDVNVIQLSYYGSMVI